MSTETDGTATAVLKRIERWREDLVDLSRRNPLINFRSGRAVSTWIQSPELSSLLNASGKARRIQIPPPDEELEEVESPGEENQPRLELPYGPENPDEGWIVLKETDPERIYRGVERMASRERSEHDDTGLRTLYLAIGFLRWTEPASDKEILSPLILAPVSISRANPRSSHEVHLVDDEETVVNPALTLKLRESFGLELSDDWDWEDKPVDQELDEIESALAELAGLKVERTAAIGRFNFQKLVMYRDLGDNRDRIAKHPMVAALVTGEVPDSIREAGSQIPDEGSLDQVDDPGASASILDADASQRQCIIAARSGASMVIKGPPGTGKSQTIANMIAELLAEGKSILFVSEKLAALDVVYSRLKQAGITQYVLRLHGSNASRKEVVQQLADSLTYSPSPGRDMKSEDVSALAALRSTLNQTSAELHASRPLLADRNVFTVNGELVALGDYVSVSRTLPKEPLSEGRLATAELNSIRQNGEELLPTWNDRCRSSYPWRGFRARHLTQADIDQIGLQLAQAEERLDHVADLDSRVRIDLGLSRIEEGPAGPIELANLVLRLREMPKMPRHWITRPDFDQTEGEVLEARRTCEDLSRVKSGVLERFPGAVSASELLVRDGSLSFQRALADLGRNMGRAETWESDLIPHLLDAAELAERGPEVLLRLGADSRTVAESLGDQGDRLSMAGIGRLTCLGEKVLSSPSDSRPLPNWLHQIPHAQAERLTHELEALVEQFERDCERAFTTWKPEAMESDATGLLERFEYEYQAKSFKVLRSGYRADASTIKAMTRNGKLPEDCVDSLRALKAAIDSRQACRKFGEREVLGRYFKGEDTVIASIRRALGLATECRDLASTTTDLEILGSALDRPDRLSNTATTALDRSILSFKELTEVVSGMDMLFPETTMGDESKSPELIAERLRASRASIDFISEQVRILERARGRGESSLSQVEREVEELESLHRAQQAVVDRDDAWRRLIGPTYQAEETDWDQVDRSLAAVRELGTSFEVVPDRIVDRVAEDGGSDGLPDPEALLQANRLAEEAMHELLTQFSPDEAPFGTGLESDRAIVAAMKAEVHSLRAWSMSELAYQELKRLNWNEPVDRLVAQAVDADQVIPALVAAFWAERLDVVLPQVLELQRFSGRKADELIKRFRHLDKELILAGQARVREACNRRKPAPINLPGSETRTIEREAKKKRRFMSTRRLLRSVPTVLPQIKPCVMMSPLTVSHFLSGDQKFDVVIFDEASQVKPEDAINAIYRGDQLIVAGDDKQLPPTSFFDRARSDETDDEDDAVEEGLESLLDEAIVALRPANGEQLLRWHYRSRHQDLIAFSNDRFYGGQLFVFASPTRDRSVKLHYVEDGVYDRGGSKTNRIEASRLVDRVIELRRGGQESVGVVALNRNQADAISDELARRQMTDPSLDSLFAGDRLSGLFVKNLESVQGDERDVILLSVGYGRDAAGKFTMAFGPLNGEHGPRRLNVAVTRAREGLEVFSSVRAEDFPTGTTSTGARLLRMYIDYARNGVEVLAESLDTRGGETDSPFEDAVLSELRALGYDVVPQVGVAGYRIDLGVVHPSKSSEFVLGVECDGATYHSSQVARDRDRLREDVLRGLGWNIHRIWSTDWRFDRRGQIQRLRDAIEEAISGRPEADEEVTTEQQLAKRQTVGEEPHAQAPTSDELEDTDAKLGDEPVGPDAQNDFGALPWTKYYEPADLSHLPALGEFQEPTSTKARRRVLRELLQQESPITEDYAIRRLAEHWGIRRIGRLVEKAAKTTISQVSRKEYAERRGATLWIEGGHLDAVRIPSDHESGELRDLLTEVPDEEIDLALNRFAKIGLRDDDLIGAVARLFGYKRTGHKLKDRIKERLEHSSRS